jgi:hypothetical protein
MAARPDTRRGKNKQRIGRAVGATRLCRGKDEGASKYVYVKDDLHHQRIELFGHGLLDDIVFHLPLPDHVHELAK